MEEIDLKDLWGFFVSKIVIVIIFVLGAILLNNLYVSWFQTPMYKSSTSIVLARVNSDASDTGGITTSDITMNQKLVATYRQIITSRRIVNKVIANLNLETTYEELSKRISVSNDQDTELIRISVVDKDSSAAQTIANEITKVFSEDIVTIYNIQNISVIDYAEQAGKPYNVNFVKQTLIAIIIGLVLSCALIFVLFYFDTTIKNLDDIEEKLGLVLLGKIPLMSIEKKGGKR